MFARKPHMGFGSVTYGTYPQVVHSLANKNWG
ncbi:protein of unknown function [Paraburkholderia kururiensis]